jgi:hypothetical protein
MEKLPIAIGGEARGASGLVWTLRKRGKSLFLLGI